MGSVGDAFREMPKRPSIIRKLGSGGAWWTWVRAPCLYGDGVCVPCFTDEFLFLDFLVSPIPLPTSFRVVKYMVTLHRAEKKADSQG